MLKRRRTGSTIVRKRLPAVVLTFWSRCDAVCWPGRRSEETTSESGCWPRRGDDCRRGARRLVDRVAAVVELGLGLRQHETGNGFVPHGPRSRTRAPRQELALRVRGGPCGGNRRRA